MPPTSILKYATEAEIAELRQIPTDYPKFRVGLIALLHECAERAAVDYAAAAKKLIEQYRLLGGVSAVLEPVRGPIWSDPHNPKFYIPGSRSLKATKTTDNNWDPEYLAEGRSEVLRLLDEHNLIRTETREIFGHCPL